MKIGGNIANDRETSIIKVTGVVIPLFLIAYGLLGVAGIVPHVSSTPPMTIYIILGVWAAALVPHLLIDHRNRAQSFLLVALYTILGAVYTVMVSGFSTPPMAGWPILIMVGYLYFQNFGAWATIIAMAIACGLDTYLHSTSTVQTATNLIAFATFTIVALIYIKLKNANQLNWQELRKTRASELVQRDRILAIINNLTDGVIATDRDGVIQVYNAGSLNLLDTNESLEGKHIDEVIGRVRDAEDKTIQLAHLFRGEPNGATRDDLHIDFGDQKILIEMECLPIRTSYTGDRPVTYNHDGFIVVLRDVTRVKSLEQEKDEFISVVSHELRTPITITEGTISNLELMITADKASKEVLAEQMKTAHEQVVFLAKMVNDLSTLSRAERGVADEPELIDIKELAEDLYHEYSPRAEHAGLAFNLDIPASPGYVNASPLYLKEMLQNFITNAIKYTKKGEVSLIITTEKDAVRFAVRDTGIGISKPDLEHVFEKFFRSEDYRTRETRGTGLGLYVAAKLSRKMGTHIDIESRLNYGSTFSFSLPKAKK